MRTLTRQILGLLLALLGALLAPAARSQYTSDIDIFATPGAQTDAPNVLFIIDNTANWSPMFQREMRAIANTLDALAADRFRVGLMLFTESGDGNAGPDGGYLRAGIRTLSTTYKPRLSALVTSMDSSADRSNNGKAGMTMAEAYYYFAGQRPVTGSRKVKAEYAAKGLVVLNETPFQNTYNMVVRGLRDWSQILSNFGLAAAAIKTLRN